MNDCGCPEGVDRPPAAGLDALPYRAGTHASFLAAMLAALSGQRLPDGRRPLDRLTTRATDDPAIAQLDAWAAVADVLTFYQERIANEGYLRTATERRSVLELARLVGYRLRPGVAASVFLAFTLEKDYRIDIPAGTRAQSVPAPGELPQFFETGEPLPARTEWNAIPARRTRPTFLSPFSGQGTIYAAGAATNLKPNDTILFVCPGQRQPYTIQAVAADAAANRTRLDYRPYGAAPSYHGVTATDEPEEPPGPPLTRLGTVVAALRKDPAHPPPSRFQLSRAVARTYGPESDLAPRLLTRIDPKLADTLYTAYANASVTGTNQDRCGVEALRVSAAPFGHNAPLEVVQSYYASVQRREWTLAELTGTGRVLITSTDNDKTVTEAFGGTYDLVDTVNPLRVEVSYAGATVTVDVRDIVRAPFGAANPVFTISLALGDREVTVEVEYRGEFSETRYDDAELVRVTVTFTGQENGIRVAPPAGGPGLEVTVDSDSTRQVSPGEPVMYVDGARTVSISLNGGLTVTHRTPALVGEEQFRTLSLDAVYDRITPGSHVVVDRPDGAPIVAAVERVRTVSRADYGITARVTQLVLDQPWLTASDQSVSVLRGITVHAGGEPLDLAEEPIEDDVAGDEIELDALYDGLDAGRWLVVSGVRADVLDAESQPVDGIEASELVLLAGVTQDVHRIRQHLTANGCGEHTIELPGDTLHTRLALSTPLSFRYRRDSVRINANVARATHGETHEEILGSGDGSRSQRFTLKRRPLTHLAAPTPKGVASTLDVRVDGVRWPERETLLYVKSSERGYETSTDDEQNTTIVFGDGTHGTRLPTGVENVTATYRSGIGRSGNVAAGRINSLATRPLGVKEVVNPRHASGGADPEGRDQARRNVPLATLALDRLVSVRDFADFTRTFAGIGKASATRLSDGRRELVHLTVAGDQDAPIDRDSDLYRNLLLALRQFGDPRVPLLVEPREAVFLVLVARVRVLPDHLWETVEPRIRAALLDVFGFDRRELGQDVLLSQAIAAVQAVAGVDYVDVDVFDGVTETDGADPLALAAKLAALATGHGSPKRRVAAEPARVDAGRPRPARLAYLNPALADTLILTEVTA